MYHLMIVAWYKDGYQGMMDRMICRPGLSGRDFKGMRGNHGKEAYQNE